MKKILVLMMMIGSIVYLSSCDDSSNDPEGNSMVAVYSELSSSMATKVNSIKSPDISQDEVDSIMVTRVRVLISRIMFHGNDMPEEDNHLLKAGPYVLVGDISTGEYKFVEGQLPEGSYDKVKLEFHRFSEAERSNYLNDDVLGDFATPDRYSVIIEGTKYKDGVGTDFVYNATTTANNTLLFDTPLTIDDDTPESVYIEIDAASIFIDNNDLLDPDIQKNSNKIDNNIREILKMK